MATLDSVNQFPEKKASHNPLVTDKLLPCHPNLLVMAFSRSFLLSSLHVVIEEKATPTPAGPLSRRFLQDQ